MKPIFLSLSEPCARGLSISLFPHCQRQCCIAHQGKQSQTTKINVLFTLLSQMNGFSNRNYTRKIAFRTRPRSAREMSCHRLFVWPMHRLLENRVYYREGRWVFDRHCSKNTVRKLLLVNTQNHCLSGRLLLMEWHSSVNLDFMTQFWSSLGFITNSKI